MMVNLAQFSSCEEKQQQGGMSRLVIRIFSFVSLISLSECAVNGNSIETHGLFIDRRAYIWLRKGRWIGLSDNIWHASRQGSFSGVKKPKI